MRSCNYVAFLLLMLARIAAAQQTTGSLLGTVTHDGAVLPGVTITAMNIASGATLATVTGGHGEFHFSALTPGRYSVTASLQGLASKTVNVSVSVAQSAALNIDLAGPEPVATPATGMVTGAVKNGDGAIADASITFVPVSGGDSTSTTTHSDGTYTRDYLAPGTYDVTCSAAGYGPSTKRATVTKDKTVTLNFDLEKK